MRISEVCLMEAAVSLVPATLPTNRLAGQVGAGMSPRIRRLYRALTIFVFLS